MLVLTPVKESGAVRADKTGQWRESQVSKGQILFLLPWPLKKKKKNKQKEPEAATHIFRVGLPTPIKAIQTIPQLWLPAQVILICGTTIIRSLLNGPRGTVESQR